MQESENETLNWTVNVTTLDKIQNWMKSIYALLVADDEEYKEKKDTEHKADRSHDQTQLSPPIILVGTHRESLKGSPQEKSDKVCLN